MTAEPTIWNLVQQMALRSRDFMSAETVRISILATAISRPAVYVDED